VRVDDQITFVYVSDLERADGFYRGVLELELVLDQGGCLIYRVTPSSFLGICDLRPDQVGVRGALVTFVTDEVDAWHERLTAAGATILTQPQHNDRFAIYNFFAEDPDGNRFEVQRFDDLGWKVADA
jgi:predicted enzyme related to lactoylglutathione lyase